MHLGSPGKGPLNARVCVCSRVKLILHRCKKRFYVFFTLVTFFTFLTFFYFSNVFLFLKNVGKVQSGRQINKKHFQNNSNEIDL